MKKSTTNNILLFAFGATIGSAVTWKLLKTKYEQIAKEEIESVKEVFGMNRREFEEVGEEFAKGFEDGIKKNRNEIYENIINHESYAKYSNKKEEEKEDMNYDKPYVISPEEFDELDDYEAVSLTYYNDGVLTDDLDNVIEDVEHIVGVESLKRFGEYEDDSVFVRNDALKCDYEILADERNYSDMYRNRS